ncbi:MAG: hypothetical protein AB3N13_12150 [Arenibacterium sp.]
MTEHVLIQLADLSDMRDKIAEQGRQIERLASAIEQVAMTPPPEWVSIREYAALKGVSTRTVERQAEAGSIEVRGAGKLREVKV